MMFFLGLVLGFIIGMAYLGINIILLYNKDKESRSKLLKTLDRGKL